MDLLYFTQQYTQISLGFWTLLVACFGLLWQWSKKQHSQFSPPHIKGIPLLGVVPFLGKYPERVLKKWSQQKGEPVIFVRMGSADFAVLNTYEAVHQVLVKQSVQVAGRPYMHVYSQLSQNRGIVFKDYDDDYKVQRNFGMRALKHGFGVGRDAMENVINEETSHFIEHIKGINDKPIDIKTHLFRLSANIVCKVAMGRHFEYDDVEFVKAMTNTSYIVGESEDAFKFVMMNLFPNISLLPPFRQANARAKRRYVELTDFISRIIDQHKSTYDPSNIRDFIDAFLQEKASESGKKDNSSFQDDQLMFYVSDFFAAGTETTASTMSWLMLCYLHFPEYHASIREEIDNKLGTDLSPSMNLRNKLPFTCAFIQEVFRFRSTVNLAYRKVKSASVTVGGYTLPKDTRIIINIWGVHNDPKTWANPEIFDPRRHMDENGEFLPSNNIIPFGAGYRICMGERIARAEIFIIFVKILQKFDISAACGDLPTIDDSYNNLIHTPLPYELTMKCRDGN